MTRESMTIALLILCFFISCKPNQKNSPIAGPVSTLRNDEYIYSFGKFYAASSQSFIHLGFVDPVPNAPIVWVQGEPVEINVDTPETVVERLGPPDERGNDGQLVYRSKKAGAFGPSAVFYVKANSFSTIAIAEEGGISLTKDSEILTVPFSRDDLIRVFGQPKEFIKSR